MMMHNGPSRQILQPQRLYRPVGAVAIGRNEGERLEHCLRSLCGVAVVVYVDSGSTDRSLELARRLGIDTIQLDASLPLTAARARNAGFRRLQHLLPQMAYVQFIDGDCELNAEWLEQAAAFLDSHPDIVAVCGRRRERFPRASVYNWLCDAEWNVAPAANVDTFFGDVLLRAGALEAVGGYRDNMIDGEEPELSIRLRAAGWKISRLPAEMTLHDANMARFSQWWKRHTRSGFAFAEGAHLHGSGPDQHFVWESQRAQIWGLWLALGCAAASFAFWPWGLFAWMIYPLQLLRQSIRNPGPLADRIMLAFFQVLSRFPEAVGQLKFLFGRLFAREVRPIEYK